ncbi:MAG: 16S rRNA (adenine(1518)-N(6)/adenine(1519)-N(6))-dimethyltransferase RsmA [Deltaproteobacteria bacterium]|nr:16S rRNA (adenine(1518)-N(6)/adenine(1519)-N(6))-dimethyltransferase RsmA [Deltaproteobacteria bacterium]
MSRLAAETRALLQREGLAPRKSLGQHFLVDQGVVARMLDLAQVSDQDAVLEIGPGVGALTDVLAVRSARLYVVEYDRGLAVVLRRKFAGRPEVKVIEGDALEVDLRGEIPETDVKVVASLPYNVSVPILFRLIEERRVFADLTVMVQKEVADRLLAKVGTRAYGGPSVLFQLYAEPIGRFRVPSAAFYPRPQVASEVLRVRLASAPRVPVAEPRLLAAVVRAAFNQRRKMLRNAVQTLAAPFALPPPAWDEVFAAAGVDPRARGETLDLATFARFSDAVGRALAAADTPRRTPRPAR